MPPRISCPQGHATRKIAMRDAAVSLSENHAIGACEKCGKPLHYQLDHVNSNDPTGKQHTFKVTRAVRLRTRPAKNEKYDPFLLLLRDVETGAEQILPVFWMEGESAAQRGGPFSPAMTLQQWKELFRRLDADFVDLNERIRMRAYEIYDQRGRSDGYALNDWLQAQAELTADAALLAAA
ncbi:MAG TPA: DUF2934 domain-containing protein [Candidatus Acidoferrum sp.]|nr:DUF2934 domain-containing protein [Candidatus Acidoferrum sp.]